LPKTIGKTKFKYLELLIENQESGITPSEVVEVFFDGVTNEAANNALRRLKKGGCAIRKMSEEGEFRYWITNRGIRRYDYLQEKQDNCT